MHRFPFPRAFVVTVLCAVLAASALAGAFEDVSIRSEPDEGDTVYKLVNVGDQTVRATVRLVVECSGVQSTRDPIERDYWVGAQQSIVLGKTRAESSCTRQYDILEAVYP